MIFCIAAAASASEHRLQQVRIGYWEDRVRLVCDLDSRPHYEYRVLTDPHRVELDLSNTDGQGVQPPGIRDRVATGILIESPSANSVRLTVGLAAACKVHVFTVPPGDGRPDRVVCDIFHPGAEPAKPAQPIVPAPETQPRGETAPSAKKPAEIEPWVVMIDAGHGGMDPGAVHGKPRLQEKEITLDVAKVLARELATVSGITVQMTRQKDEYVGLRERLRKAEGAGVFVSIHVNGCNTPSACGPEVFFLSMSGASDAASKELEAFENQAVMGAETLAGELAELPFAVDLIQTDTLKRSSLLAEVLLNELGEDGLTTSRGVRQANFVVLRSIRVPSVLVELGFLSNDEDAAALRSPEHREALGKSLAEGLIDFRSRFARHSPSP